MTEQEIIDVMEQKKSPSKVDSYRTIYQLATGVPFTKCLCGSGFDLLYKVCKNYAEQLIKNKTIQK